jgi:hypothetical protein
MTMTTSQETMTDAVRRSQEAISNTLQIWADSVARFMPVSDPKMTGAVEAVDTLFDFAEQMLGTQREFTKSVLAITTSTATKGASAMKDATMDVKGAAKDVQDVQDGPNGQRSVGRRSAHDVDAGSKKS